jgi:hypothetical protein
LIAQTEEIGLRERHAGMGTLPRARRNMRGFLSREGSEYIYLLRPSGLFWWGHQLH